MNKKLLILGGKPFGSCEIVSKAKEMGIYTIVADYLPTDESPAKKIADESWLVSTADINELKKKSKEAKIDGVIAGVHEFNIEKAIELCEKLELPHACSLELWRSLLNKRFFKEKCRQYAIPVSEEYSIHEKEKIGYPVICKPIDSSGSRGFSVCYNENDLIVAYQHALNFSESKSVLIEKYNPHDAVIIHYTLVNGKIIFSGMSDKKSMILKEGGSVMALQTFLSKNTDDYINCLNQQTVRMLQDLGIKNGAIWIEAFNNDGNFTFNEMGFRFGGSLTYYPVQYYTGFDQLEMAIQFALGINENKPLPKLENKGLYGIFPLHVHAGQIAKVYGLERIKQIKNLYAYVPSRYVGDKIEDWKSAQQVFCYLHILYKDMNELKSTIQEVIKNLNVIDEKGKELLFCLYDLDLLQNT